MTVILGLLAAAFYGVSDFAGGVASRRQNSITILLYSYPVGAVLMAALLPFFPGTVTIRVVVFGILGGMAGLLGVSMLYQLMVTAPMNIVSPVSAVLAAMVPVAVGVTTGDRPAVTAWLGIALGVLAVVLVSRTTDDHPNGRLSLRVVGLACVAGIGFGLYFVFLARAGHHSGLWPLLISRIASAILILPLAAGRRAFARVGRVTFAIAVTAGGCDALANLFFVLASHTGLLSLASVLTALYPAVTVLLAVGLLHEHASRVQRVGLGLAAVSVVLITI